MVLPFYQLREQPFGVTPDSRYFFLSDTHGEALASLLYGVDAGCGFLALIAAPGLGKTTLLYDALRFLRQSAVTVFLFETVCTPLDLLRSLLTALGVKDAHGNLARMQSRLQEVLIEQARLGRRVVVVMDEAQNLDHALLELIRMLSNFETQQQKLLQIILAGQPHLAETIASPGLEQLRQRISIFAHLKPFSREETQLYIEHRLRVAGYAPQDSIVYPGRADPDRRVERGRSPHHQQPVFPCVVAGMRTQAPFDRHGDHSRGHCRSGCWPVEREKFVSCARAAAAVASGARTLSIPRPQLSVCLGGRGSHRGPALRRPQVAASLACCPRPSCAAHPGRLRQAELLTAKPRHEQKLPADAGARTGPHLLFHPLS